MAFNRSLSHVREELSCQRGELTGAGSENETAGSVPVSRSREETETGEGSRKLRSRMKERRCLVLEFNRPDSGSWSGSSSAVWLSRARCLPLLWLRASSPFPSSPERLINSPSASFACAVLMFLRVLIEVLPLASLATQFPLESTTVDPAVRRLWLTEDCWTRDPSGCKRRVARSCVVLFLRMLMSVV